MSAQCNLHEQAVAFLLSCTCSGFCPWAMLPIYISSVIVFSIAKSLRNDGWFEVLSYKTLAPIHPKRAHAFGGTWSVMGPCRILPNHKRCTAFLTSPGEARKAFSFPWRHGMTWPSQNTITHVIQFLHVARLCFHCHFSKLNFCRAQVPTLWEHTWYWFVSVAGNPPPTPFRLSPPVPGDLLHQRVSGGPVIPSPETLLRSWRQSIPKDRGEGFFLWLWDGDNTDPAHQYLAGVRFRAVQCQQRGERYQRDRKLFLICRWSRSQSLAILGVRIGKGTPWMFTTQAQHQTTVF